MSTNLDGNARNGGRLRADAVLEEDRPWMALVEKEGALGVRDGLIGVGVTAPQAGGIAFWLEDQRRLHRVVGSVTIWNYRKILRALDPDKVKRAILG
jgi:hypothetical protein